MPRIARRRLSLLFFVSSPLLVLLATAACQPGAKTAHDADQRPISLLNRWSEVEISDAVTPPEAPARSELRFDVEDTDGQAVAATWKVLGGVEDLRVEAGSLVGRSSDEKPVILVEYEEPQGVDDELWSVEIRLRTSAGKRVGVHPIRHPGPPDEVVRLRADDWPITSAVASPDPEKAQTFSIVLDRIFLLEMPPAQTSIQRVAIRPSDVPDADFAIESLRLVFRKERLAAIDSGPGWHGLGEIFRESLVSRAPESLGFQVELPARPWLELAVGTIDESSPDFFVELEADGKIEALAELRAEEAEKWQAARIDLGRWAGDDVKLWLRAVGDPGQLAFWGTPTIRSSIAEAAPADRPQAVVVFLADTLRSDHLDAWGYDRETAPTLKRLASEGVRFERAVAQSTWTKVSVSSILTSLYPSTSGVAGLHDRISAGETTLAEAFREAGYATFATSSVPFSGQLTNLHQGVEVMCETGALPSQGATNFRSKTARPWVDLYLEWLEQHRDVPTFALIHAMDPHSPFLPEPPFDEMWASEESAARFEEDAAKVRPLIKSPLLQRFMAPTSEELEAAGVDAERFVEHEKAWYDGSIRGLDTQLERLVGELDNFGLGDRSLLAFVSDHGEAFLEHGRHWHGEDVYGEVTNVPMALWGAGVPQGVVVDRVVQTIDLMPTLLDLAGLGIPTRAQGRSLRPLFDGGELRSVPAFVELPSSGRDDLASYAILDGGFKLVWFPKGDVRELYDIANDPLDQNDLAGEHPEDVARLDAELQRFLSWAESQQLDDAELTSEMSAEQLEQLRSLGYIE